MLKDMLLRKGCFPLALAVLVAATTVASAGVVYKIDMNGGGGDLAAGWTEVNNGNRFDKPIGHGEEPALLSDGTARAGYNGWNQGFERDRGENGSWTFSQEYKDLLQDFSNPQNTGARLIVWNVPEGDYQVTAWMHDWQWGGGTNTIEGHDGTLLSVNHDDFDNSDPASGAATQMMSTILYDPDGGSGNYDTKPSLWFTYNSGKALNGLMLEEVVQPVPEPAGLSLLGLALLGLRRKRR